MKNTKRFASIATAALLAACAVVPSMASMPVWADTTVKVDDGDADHVAHTYTAYQIFSGTYNDNGLTITGWGNGYNSTSLLADTEFKNFVVVDADSEASPPVEAQTMAQIIGDSTDAAVVAQALELIGDQSAKADALAEILAKYTDDTGTTVTAEGTSLSEGYYIIKDNYTVETDPATNDALSKFILRVAGGSEEITITPKKSYPSVVKKVEENSNIPTSYSYTYGEENTSVTDTNYNDVADYHIGDTVDFKLYGTMPDTLADYTEGYKYVFHDTIASSLTLVDGDDADTDVDVVVTIDGTTVDASCYTVKNTTSADTVTGFTVTFEDVTEATSDSSSISVTKDSVVTVAYSAVLNENAEIGLDGQENEVYLEYSNNPEWDGTGTPTTDRTPTDKVIVFTYELDTTKQDAATQEKLQGAKFKLANAATGGQYAILNETDQENVYTFGGWDINNTGTEITTPEGGVFKILGLDESTYWLEETAAPTDDYNKLENRVQIEIIANTLDSQTTLINADNSPYTEAPDRQNWSGTASDALKELGIKVDGAATATAGDVTSGVVNATINNSKGTDLPSTGGIGTTIFYIGGGVLVVGAGVLLIAKKRAKEATEA